MVAVYVVVLIIPVALAFFSAARLLGLVPIHEYEPQRELI
jgi:hypothetical protein